MRVLALVISLALLAGCASPTVVQTRQISDENLNCTQLIQATEEAQQFERESRGERKVTGTNVAAAILFWPGLLATYVNTDDAIDAAKERQTFLRKLYDRKGCSDAMAVQFGSSVSKELEKLKEMYETGLINSDEYKAARKKTLGL